MTDRPPLPPPGRTRSGAVHRVAGVQLRGRTGPLPARAYWPPPPGPGPAPALLVLFPDPAGGLDVPDPPDLAGGLDAADALCRGLCSGAGLVVLSVSHRAPQDAIAATRWAADHAAELGADPRRLLVGGVGAGGRVATAVVREARDEGWPAILRQVLVRPRLGGPEPPGAVPALAPATVVTVDGVDEPAGTPTDDGWHHAALLRHAGVDVDELRYGGPPDPDRLVGDLARALGRALTAADPVPDPAAAPPPGQGPDRSVSR